jgi:hypothetical protein
VCVCVCVCVCVLCARARVCVCGQDIMKHTLLRALCKWKHMRLDSIVTDIATGHPRPARSYSCRHIGETLQPKVDAGMQDEGSPHGDSVASPLRDRGSQRRKQRCAAGERHTDCQEGSGGGGEEEGTLSDNCHAGRKRECKRIMSSRPHVSTNEREGGRVTGANAHLVNRV